MHFHLRSQKEKNDIDKFSMKNKLKDIFHSKFCLKRVSILIKIEYRRAGVDIGLVFSRLGWPTHVWENIQIIGNIYLFSI